MGSIGEIFDLDWSEGWIIDAPILIPVPGHLLQKPSFRFLYFKVYIFIIHTLHNWWWNKTTIKMPFQNNLYGENVLVYMY